VPDSSKWGLTRAYFAGGFLNANDRSGFSETHQFYALNVDKTWLLPACYLRTSSAQDDHKYGCFDPAKREAKAQEQNGAGSPKKQSSMVTGAANNGYPGWWRAHYPGISTYFETRLTAIPVSSVNSANTPTSASSSNSGGSTPGTIGTNDNATTSGAAITSNATNNFITTQKPVRVGTGVYFPFLMTRWNYDHHPNALFLAPLAKVGFDTITGPTSQSVIDPNSHAVVSQSYENIYNSYSFGGRVGHMQLTQSRNRAPETYSYLDITLGRYSNLESYICHASGSPTQTVTDATCPSGLSYPSRKRLYRLDLEGLLKIPDTFIYLGFNANIAQRVFGVQHLNQQFRAPDDLRFFFGTKFDISTVFQKLGLASSQ
jgi:hypothetical protein